MQVLPQVTKKKYRWYFEAIDENGNMIDKYEVLVARRPFIDYGVPQGWLAVSYHEMGITIMNKPEAYHIQHAKVKTGLLKLLDGTHTIIEMYLIEGIGIYSISKDEYEPEIHWGFRYKKAVMNMGGAVELEDTYEEL